VTYTLRFLGVRISVGMQGQKSWSCLKCGTVRVFTPATAAALRKRNYSAGCCFRPGEENI
jgi:ferredoxin-like protein FixX